MARRDITTRGGAARTRTAPALDLDDVARALHDAYRLHGGTRARWSDLGKSERSHWRYVAQVATVYYMDPPEPR